MSRVIQVRAKDVKKGDVLCNEGGGVEATATRDAYWGPPEDNCIKIETDLGTWDQWEYKGHEWLWVLND